MRIQAIRVKFLVIVVFSFYRNRVEVLLMMCNHIYPCEMHNRSGVKSRIYNEMNALWDIVSDLELARNSVLDRRKAPSYYELINIQIKR